MNPDDIVDKTEKGLAVVKSRDRELLPRLRSLLIMVDGRQTVGQLRSAGTQIGAPVDALETLADLGLVLVRGGRGGAARLPEAPADPAPLPVPPASPQPAGQGDPAETAGRLRAAQKFMNDTVADALGVRAVFFTLKLERCFTRDDLLALLPEFRRLIAKSRGEGDATALESRARGLMP